MKDHLKTLISYTSLLKKYKLLWIIILVYAIYFSTLSIIRYHYYYTGLFDLGNMNQTLWNTLHGHIFMETDPAGTGKLISRMADHADILLLFLVPFYAIFSSAIFLLIFQSLFIALGAIPVFLFTKERTKSKFLPYFFACLYLFFPSVENPNLFEFHAVALSMTLLLFAFYSLSKKQYIWASCAMVLAMFSKEEVGFTVSLMALYFFIALLIEKIPKKKLSLREIFHRITINFLSRKREAIFLLLACIIAFSYSVIIIEYVIPYFRGAPSLYLAYYTGSSGGISGIFGSILSNPQSFIQSNFGYDFRYSADLLLPSGGLGIFSPAILLISFPEWLIDCLSRNHFMQSIFYQYPSVLNPFIILSSISGFFAVDRFFTKRFSYYKTGMLVGFVLICSIIASYNGSSLPFSKNFTPLNVLNLNISKPDRDEITKFGSSVPINATISADNNLGSHLSSRPNIYEYPTDDTTAEYLVLRAPNTPPNANYELLYAGSTISIYQKIGT